MRLRYAAKSDVGMLRPHNEDRFAVSAEHQLFAVADGMGGHASGEVAATIATEAVVDFYQLSRDPETTWPFRVAGGASRAENRLICAIGFANRRIRERAGGDASLARMGTTIVALCIDELDAVVAHVGDSRAYIVRHRLLRQLTRDHSLLEETMRANPAMTEAERRAYPHRNVITRALGLEAELRVDAQTQRLRPGDRLLLCSDGLSGMLDPEALLRCLSAATPPQPVVDDLVDRANRAGGADNVTAVVIDVGDAG